MFAKDNELYLRAVEPADSKLLYEWENDLSLWQVSERFAPLSHFEIEQFILNNQDLFANKQLRLMIDIQTSNHSLSIGTVDIYDLDLYHQRAGIGILIDAPYRNKGYARRAMILTQNYCFKVLKLHQVYGLIAADNQASLKLFSSLNYTETAKKTDWLKKDDGFIDQYQFQLHQPEKKSK